jgi:hypothetical protein
MGLSQIPVEFEYTLADPGAEDLRIECSLLSAYNEVLHTVRQEVRSVGILADAEEVSRHAHVDDVASVLPSSDLLSESEHLVEGKTPAKGLFSWFRR